MLIKRRRLSTAVIALSSGTLKHAPLKLRDVRNLFRLIAEIRRVGDEPNDWRPFMVKELIGLFNAELVVSSEIYVTPTSDAGVWEVCDIGWGAGADGQTWRIESTTRETDPAVFDVMIRDSKPATGDRIPIQPTKPMHEGTTFILSNQLLPHLSAIDQLGIHRGGGVATFTASDHRLLRLLHVELGRFWRKDILRATSDPTRSLAPRLKQTLELLVDGNSEKQIAFQLKISPHTVHNYVKALHQRFNVSSRGELIAAANKVEKQFIPRLSRPDLPDT
jgi:DNA-binding CsgD family transcriptional regulator